MAYGGPAPVNPHLAALAKDVHRITGDISGPFRKGEYTIVLQQFDMLMATSAVEEVAVMAVECREEMRELDLLGRSLNVLGPDFLTWRLTTPQGRAIGVNGNYSLPKPSTVSDDTYQLYLLEQRIEDAWGQVLLASIRQMPDEQEHHEEIVNDFERFFERCSDYLRAMLQDTMSAVHLLDVTVMDTSELSTQYVVCAALMKHPPPDVAALVKFIEYLKQRSIPLSLAAAEQLERIYLRFMKGKAAADVFESVTAAGVIPLSVRPFAMLFNNLTDANAVLDAYDLMLDYSIAPEESTLRILCKQSRMEYAKLHFTTVLKNMANATSATQSQSPSPPPPRSPLASGGAGAAAAHTSAAASASTASTASRRRDERSYFAQRIEELAERKPKASLLEALKVLHRAEVEGTSLQGDTYIMSALLRHYCRSTTPRHYLVLPFSESLAYRPGPVSDGALPASDVEAGGNSKVHPAANAFDFGHDPANEELLEGEGKSAVNEELEGLSGAPTRSRGGEPEAEKGRRPRPRPRDPYFADSSEEGTYILEVLKSYGSYPDNSVLQALSAQYEGQVPHMEIVASAADAFFEGCMASHGAMSPVDCRFLHALGYYYIDNRWRDRAHLLVRRVLEMFYAYHVTFRADLGGTEKWFSYFAVIVGTKTGPLDLGIGLFAASLALSDKTVNPKVATKLTAKRDSSEHVIEVISELEKCGWDYHRILCCDALMLEPQERASAGNNESSAGANGAGSRDHHHGRGANGSRAAGAVASSAVAAGEEHLGKESIYTSAGQGPSSYNNSHLLSARPSLVTYMYVALRDLGVDKKTADWLRDKLKAARQEALASKRTR
ncbi:conserved hypothetical protein [Leishmania infantum JPCM5]|uniref:Uncharacterized protein n=2 Tax=Leishmania infantum TaxID=5671 RepID=A4HZC4_LEIIN|nr:conserved hypothetical protein [Leishmania infantum JPCM5]CAC9486388.1 hypothetical_protein_-_conserved [Leishmania infantum]CAM67836.1 conserved hypothetical protein [Leishmania infantum JPCM5]SUZ41610.1 hypothetical_protein_-_conserved [Leishmania infantum]|eukprot:XP_001465415.1 conserved hypothetical protein [Leishmania infantum JPCM5]